VVVGISDEAIAQSRELLLKEKAQYYSWPTCTNQFTSATFVISNIIYFLQN